MTGRAAVVEKEDSFMFFGGSGMIHSSNTRFYSDKIYQWNNNDNGGQWLELPFSLSEEKYRVTAIKVKPSIFKSCSPGKVHKVEVLRACHSIWMD